MNRYSTINDSSSSSFLSDGLSFILEKASDDAPILEYVLDIETNTKTLELVMRLRQARKDKRASSSSRRP